MERERLITVTEMKRRESKQYLHMRVLLGHTKARERYSWECVRLCVWVGVLKCVCERERKKRVRERAPLPQVGSIN